MKKKKQYSKHALYAISPIDGRYADKTNELQMDSSEYSLMIGRLRFEILYLIALLKKLNIPLSERQINILMQVPITFALDVRCPLRVKTIEGVTNHDVKAIEEYLREVMKRKGFSKKIISFIHFGLTSADVDNFTRTGMLLTAEVALHNTLGSVMDILRKLVEENESIPMLARTHGQPATPTTFGKEINVFKYRLKEQLDKLYRHVFNVKFGGATGNLNAHYVAYPKIDWNTFASKFIFEQHGGRMKRNPVTTQIDSYDSHAEYFAIIQRINSILIDLSRDMWLYIMNELVVQKPKDGEVGSSTMPHKVNPIDFENAEGNLDFANAQLAFYQQRLMTSRLQRDLTDSTIVRNFGSTLAYCLIGYKSLLKGLGKIYPNKKFMSVELENHPEVVTEAIQTILRREGYPDAYNKFKDFIRGKQQTVFEIRRFALSFKLKESVKDEIKEITPANYIGDAINLAKV